MRRAYGVWRRAPWEVLLSRGGDVPALHLPNPPAGTFVEHLAPVHRRILMVQSTGLLPSGGTMPRRP